MHLLISRKALSLFLSTLLVILSFALYFPFNASAAAITTSSVIMNTPVASAPSSSHAVTFTFPSTTSIQCIQVKFATSVAMSTPATTMTSGSSFTFAGTSGLTQGSWTNYGTTNGTLEVYFATGQTPSANPITITWSGVTNTSLATEYAQITTYATQASSGTTCSSPVDTSNIMALVTTPGLAASISVDPTLSFTVGNYGSAVNGSGDSGPVTTTSTTIPYGTVAGGATAWGSQTLTISTNAAHGYNLYTRYAAALTDANADTIRNQACTSSDCTVYTNALAFDGSTSQSSFAYTADDANVPFGTGPTKWLGFTTTNTKIASTTVPINSDITHIEAKLQVSNTQAPGTYSTTLTYTAAPSY